MSKTKILVVGITPPPYGGQAMMTERLIKANFDKLEILHVNMAFSQSMATVGNFKASKITHMFSVVLKALYYRFKYNVQILYYMPGGSNFIPVARDIFILSFLRLAFKKTIFHFRAAGVSEVVDKQPLLLKKLAQLVYNAPELAIHLSNLNPNDGGYFNAKRIAVVPNGLEDAAAPYLPIIRARRNFVSILFVGVVQETKGVMVLLEAAKILKEKGHKIKVNIVGEFASDVFKNKSINYVIENNLEDVINFAGEKKGEQKWEYFLDADIFCFPSYFESESFGNVLVEAMMFKLPAVGTKWRGIPDIIDENETGFLTTIKNPIDTADKLEELIINSDLRNSFGNSARQKYLSRYQPKSFLNNLQSHFVSL